MAEEVGVAVTVGSRTVREILLSPVGIPTFESVNPMVSVWEGSAIVIDTLGAPRLKESCASEVTAKAAPSARVVVRILKAKNDSRSIIF